LVKNETLNNCEHVMSGLIALALKENYTTQESLRTIWMLIDTNKDIVVDLNEPLIVNWRGIKAPTPEQEKNSELTGIIDPPDRLLLENE